MRSPDGVVTRIGADRFGTGPHLLGQANDQRKSQLPFIDFSQLLAAQRLHQVEHGLGGDAVAGDFVLVDADLQDGLPRDLFRAHVGRAGDRLQNALDLGGLLHQHVEVVAVEDGGHVGAHAGDHLVHPHLDGLRHGDPLARQVAEFFLDQLGQFVLGLRPLPLLSRLERDEDVGQLDAHRVGRHFGRADAAPGVEDLVRERLQEGLFHLRCCSGSIPPGRFPPAG